MKVSRAFRLATIYRVAAGCAVVLALGLTMVMPPALAQGRDLSKVEVKATKVAGCVYFVEGAGGNIAACVGEDGIVLVDDQFAPLADRIRAALAKLGVTDKPVRFVINTHYHPDHTGGNLPFAEGPKGVPGATIVAQENVRRRLATSGRTGNRGSIRMEREAAPAGALPVVTFERDVTIHVNGEDIRALHFPSGHTDGDAIVFFPKANVVHMGDDFVRYGFPFVDLDAGGSVRGMVAALKAVIPQLPADVKVIPGHGKVSTLDDVRAFVAMIEDTSAVVDKALAEGRTLDEMKKAEILEPWARFSGDFVSSDAWLETLVASPRR